MIKKTYTFRLPASDVWAALTDRFIIQEWSGHPAVMSPQAGTQFSLWEGDVHGTNMEVIPEQKLVQNWFGGDWDAPSVVTFTLSEKDGVTTVDLEHTGIPADETADFAAGWDDYYMGPIQAMLEPFSVADDEHLPHDMRPSDIYDESLFGDAFEGLRPSPPSQQQQDQSSQQPGPPPTPPASPPPANPQQPQQ